MIRAAVFGCPNCLWGLAPGALRMLLSDGVFVALSFVAEHTTFEAIAIDCVQLRVFDSNATTTTTTTMPETTATMTTNVNDTTTTSTAMMTMTPPMMTMATMPAPLLNPCTGDVVLIDLRRLDVGDVVRTLLLRGELIVVEICGLRVELLASANDSRIAQLASNRCEIFTRIKCLFYLQDDSLHHWFCCIDSGVGVLTLPAVNASLASISASTPLTVRYSKFALLWRMELARAAGANTTALSVQVADEASKVVKRVNVDAANWFVLSF